MMADVNEEKRVLSPELLEKARVELNEIQSEVAGHIEALRQRILEDPTTNFRTDDSFLLKFLRARHFEQDETFELMSEYYKQRENYPLLFSKTKSELTKITDGQVIGVLPNRDSNGNPVIFIRTEYWNAKQLTFEELIFQLFLTQEILLEDETVQINGLAWVFEMGGFGLSHMPYMTPWKIKEAVTVLLNTFPAQIKGVHYVNEPSIFHGVYKIIKRFLNKNIQDKMMFHGKNLESLHKHVTPEILPKPLGGDLDPVDFTPCNKNLLQNFERLTDDLKYGFVQSK